ncbi:MAG: RNA-binding protein, partial [Thermodesulfobacteriota bacterium]|nr:RNA-binding protein [Thermodesulfobacteriota bacterium]
MQSSKLYVGNLNYSIDDVKLGELFSQYGEVKHVNVIEGKGFGFVVDDHPRSPSQRLSSRLS